MWKGQSLGMLYQNFTYLNIGRYFNKHNWHLFTQLK